MPAVFLTIDTEFAWRHHVAGLGLEAISARSLEPARVGLGYQLERLGRAGLKACFFVDPMPAAIYGIAPFERIVRAILTAGQEVQLHLHPQWHGGRVGDRGRSHGRFELIDFSRAEQRDLLARARDLLVAAGAPTPIAFRAGSYGANDDTLAALASLGFEYDSSHNGAEHPWPSAIGLAPERIAPVARAGLIEVPVTLIRESAGGLRHFQICSISTREMRAALDHAIAEDHAAVTIVGHSFELATRNGLRANRAHVRRFEALCAMLAERREAVPTAHFHDRPALTLDRADRPLGPSAPRLRLRQAEQLWSNWVEERRA